MTTNLELEDIARRLEIRNFHCVIKVELNSVPRKRLVNVIANLENSDKRGRNWYMLFAVEEQKIYYFPFGDPIANEPCKFLLALDERSILRSDIKLQDVFEDTCGLYCVLILYLLNEGLPFVNIVLSLVDQRKKVCSKNDHKALFLQL